MTPDDRARQVVGGLFVALRRAKATRRPFAYDAPPDWYGGTVGEASKPTRPGHERIIVVGPEETEDLMGLAKRVYTMRQLGERIPEHILRCLAPIPARPKAADWRSLPVESLGLSPVMLGALGAARLLTAGEFWDFQHTRRVTGTVGMFGVSLEDFSAAVEIVEDLRTPPKPPAPPRPPRPEVRYILPEYCAGPFYMGWWLYERDRPDGSRNDDGWGWLRDGRQVDRVREMVVGLGHADAPPVDRWAPGGQGIHAFVDWFAAKFPGGFRVRVVEGDGPRYRDPVDLNSKPSVAPASGKSTRPTQLSMFGD